MTTMINVVVLIGFLLVSADPRLDVRPLSRNRTFYRPGDRRSG